MSPGPTSQSRISPELKLRIVSAIVLAVIVLIATVVGGITFKLLCVIVALAIYYEFATICRAVVSASLRLAGFAFLLGML